MTPFQKQLSETSPATLEIYWTFLSRAVKMPLRLAKKAFLSELQGKSQQPAQGALFGATQQTENSYNRSKFVKLGQAEWNN